MTEHVPLLPFSLDPLIGEARGRMRRRRFLVAVVAIALVAAGVGAALAFRGPSVSVTAKRQSPIRVILTAKNHQPRVSDSPYKHWWYSVEVTTATGKSVAATLHLRILSGRTPVEGVGLVTFTKKGSDHWSAAIGGEASVLHGLPRGKKLIFQAVVRAKGVTVKRNWPIVVR
jgi:hypothetical protein